MFNYKKLIQLRKDKSITQADLAKILSVSEGAVAMWETGKRQPSNDTTVKIAQYFNVTTDYLLGNNTEIKTAPEVGAGRSVELDKILEKYEVMFNGIPVSDEAKREIAHIIEYQIYREAKQMNKRKPKKI